MPVPHNVMFTSWTEDLDVTDGKLGLSARSWRHTFISQTARVAAMGNGNQQHGLSRFGMWK